MDKITFITGNVAKAEYLAKTINMPIAHQKVELDEIQSLDLEKIAEHKAKQAYDILKTPVLVDDASLRFDCMGNLPGPFIRWFIDEIGNEKICKMISGDRSAYTEICFGLYDGKELKLFKPGIKGRIAESPRGENGFGYDMIFIPEGYDKTWAEMDDEEKSKTFLRNRAYKEIEEYLKK